MLMLGWSVHLSTLFSWASLTKQLTRNSCTNFRLLLTTLLESAEGRRINVEIISGLHQGGIELKNPGSAVRQISAARHVSDWATQPGDDLICKCGS